MINTLRIFIHDYAGHAFPVSLSRALAQQGHVVCHAFASALQTPRGALSRRNGDPDGLEFMAVEMSPDYVKDKYSFLKRRQHERNYGRAASDFLRQWKPDVVLSGNTPTETQGFLLEAAEKTQTPFIYWVQDFYSLAVTKLVRKKLPILGEAIGWHYRRMDRSHLRRSASVISITEDFLPFLNKWRIPSKRSYVIPNWAELEAFPVTPKTNPWSQKHGLSEAFVFLYSGTMGMKHNPELLVRLAETFIGNPDVKIVINSEGLGADHLSKAKKEKGLNNLVINGYQPFEQLPEVLATADVLITILEPDAGIFSVPSKTLSYLCAGRSILGAMPTENLAAQIVATEGAGRVVAPFDVDGFVQAAKDLYSNQASLQDMGANARAYAEATFSIETITARFEEIFGNVVKG